MTTAEWFHETQTHAIPFAYVRGNDEAFVGWDVVVIMSLAAIILIFIHSKLK